MAMIKAKAIKSFELRGSIKTKRSAPFDIDSSQFTQLEARGLVEKAADAADESSTTQPKRRGRAKSKPE